MAALWIVAFLLVTIVIAAKVKPDWFNNVYETTVAWFTVSAVPVLMEILHVFQVEQGWRDAVPDQYEWLPLVIISVAGYALRHMNTDRHARNDT